MSEIEELKAELEFAQNRISDLLVERDTGKWRAQAKLEAIDEFNDYWHKVSVDLDFDIAIEVFKDKLKSEVQE